MRVEATATEAVDLSDEFPRHRTGPGDGARFSAAPDSRGPEWKPQVRSDYHPPFDGGADPEAVVKFESRDFH